ncbi:MAG: GIY-YIG nuclease family protein [Candidatus Thermoplasmatota archaeon]|nr:GIY-YIG nuclease family protein [Candidatus Thermoplasmatota archaeon]
MKGTYLLVMELPHDTTVLVGKLGSIHFQKGCYVYVGSAFNGVEQRIQRHLRKQKKKHWHIDYLLPCTRVIEVFYKESNQREECTIAGTFEGAFSSIPGFGCSDCSCTSHLFSGSSHEISRRAVKLHMMPYRREANA